MGPWDERVRGHRVWTEMATLGPAIDQSLSVEGITPESVLDLERLKAVLTYCGKRIAAADPLITVPQPLDLIASSLQAINNALAAFISNGDSSHIVAANQNADAVLPPLSQIPGDYSPEELGALIAATSEYRVLVRKALSEAKQEVKQLNSLSEEGQAKLSEASEGELAKLKARLDNYSVDLAQFASSLQIEQQKLSQIATDHQGQFSSAQEARSKEFSESLRAGNENLTRLITDYQSQFSSAQDARSAENTAAELARQKTFNDTIAEFIKKLADQDAEFTKQRTAFVTASETDLGALVSEFKVRGTEIVDDLREKQNYVEKLVGVIGNLGVTSGYLRVANQSRWAMWLWQAVTVGSMITLSIVAYRTLHAVEGQNGQFSWVGFAARVLVLLSLGVIAAYSGIQGDRLFTEERRNRKLALELEAIGPYLAPLPVEDQNKFRIQIGERSFGREADIQFHGKSPTSVVDLANSKELKELVKFAVETAINAIKK
ncbi:hypothetical protein [Occallatibacter riparius]|uniref:Uncharacterized protein n=1 Tax=Occallatibacter riparius TaxID=1002689 RepID=A0A9J7BKZ1_9BACT|nr:hypothetical protein [Occallatibacter riparius]UWZ83113.1 hypothetical protein MOP44_21390 [Occallatibacter riparius]